MDLELDERAVLAAGFVVLAGVLAAMWMPGLPDRSPGQGSEFNRADIMFMSMMVIHHDQAIEMAEMAENRTGTDEVLALAENISRAQREENRKMGGWLQEAGYSRPARGHRMAGMATEEEMNRLEESSGRDFDLLFSELMVEHHRGGIRMADAEIHNGRSEKVRQLAREMVRVQQNEVEKMEVWREDWRG